MFIIFAEFPSLTSACVELVPIQPTTHSIIRGALSAVTLYTDTFVSGFDQDHYEHTHVIHSDTLLLVVYFCVKYRIDIMRNIT